MGWRSWNAYHGNVNQSLMERVMDKMVERTRTVNGKPTSLLDLGYGKSGSVGLDDNWQACGAGVDGSFFDADGNPLINTARFPNMTAMVAKAHALGLKAGWYGNNCICHVNNLTDPTLVANVYKESVSGVNGIVTLGFDEVKLDGCSQFHNTTLWASLLNATGRPVLIENCHNSEPTYPSDPSATCPYNWYRVSSDIQSNWASIMNNLHATLPFAKGPQPLSRPGCWGYPDMLEVGRLPTTVESRSHFGAWCVTSSPLVLGYDLLDEAVTDAVWDIISNTEAIAVSQAWASLPGTLMKTVTHAPSGPTPPYGDRVLAVACNGSDPRQLAWSFDDSIGALAAPSGKCVTAADTLQLQLVACDGSAAQRWAWTASTASYAPITSQGKCMDVWSGAGPPGGPRVQLYPCHDGNNQQFEAAAGGAIKVNDGLCLSAGASSQATYEVWAKPLPAGSVAVLVLNTVADVANATYPVTFSFHDVGFTAASKAAVRDVWAHADLPPSSGNVTTRAFGSHDSVFVVLSPAQ